MTIQTKFDLGQRVIIPELENTRAVVMSIRLTAYGISYAVAWFNSGKREEEFLWENELAPCQ